LVPARHAWPQFQQRTRRFRMPEAMPSSVRLCTLFFLQGHPRLPSDERCCHPPLQPGCWLLVRAIPLLGWHPQPGQICEAWSQNLCSKRTCLHGGGESLCARNGSTQNIPAATFRRRLDVGPEHHPEMSETMLHHAGLRAL